MRRRSDVIYDGDAIHVHVSESVLAVQCQVLQAQIVPGTVANPASASEMEILLAEEFLGSNGVIGQINGFDGSYERQTIPLDPASHRQPARALVSHSKLVARFEVVQCSLVAIPKGPHPGLLTLRFNGLLVRDSTDRKHRNKGQTSN